MRKTLWEKRIPTFAGIFLAVVAIFATTMLTQFGRSLLTRAGPTETPKNVKVSNVSETGFTVTWETEGAVLGSIKVGETDATSKTAFDDRSVVSDGTSSFREHIATVTGLTPSSQYIFRILSGQNTYDNNGSPFSVVTAGALSKEGRKDDQAMGSVVFPDGKPATGAIVLLNISGAQPLATVVKPSGEYLFPLTLFRSIDLASYYKSSDQDSMELTVLGVDGTLAKARTSLKNRSKIPTVTLGNEYDFTITESPSPTPQASLSSSFTAPTPKPGRDPTLTSPKQNEVFTDQKPIFKGSAASGANVKITIESNPIVDSVVADGAGTWTYQPKTPLPPGTHTITVEAPDQNGIVRILKQTFTIQPLGSQVAEAATASATPILNPTVTPKATPTGMLSPTPIPTPITALTPTLVPATPIPLVTPTIVAAAPILVSATPIPPSAIAPLPRSATILPSLFFGGVGVFLFLLGFGLLLFKK